MKKDELSFQSSPSWSTNIAINPLAVPPAWLRGHAQDVRTYGYKHKHPSMESATRLSKSI